MDLPKVRKVLEATVTSGRATGVQCAILFKGEQRTEVHGQNEAGKSLDHDTIVPWWCSAKPLGTLAFALAWQSGLVGLDDCVADHLPEYGQSGKAAVRVRHLLTHTSGIRDTRLFHRAFRERDSNQGSFHESMWQEICGSALEAEPGSTFGYSPIGNWFVLDRLLSRAWDAEPGESQRRALQECGAQQAFIQWGNLEEKSNIATGYTAESLERTTIRQLRVLASKALPGVSIWGPMSDLLRLGAAFVGADARAPIAPITLEALAATHWVSGPALVGESFPYGLGLMTTPEIFGAVCSQRTYGHGGGYSSMLVIDAAFDVVVAVYWNGRVPAAEDRARRFALARAVYGDLGLCGHTEAQ